MKRSAGFRWLRGIMCRRDVQQSTKLVAWALLDRCRRKRSKTGGVDDAGTPYRCWPGVRRLAADCGIGSPGTIINALRELERAGLIRIEARPGSRGGRAYTIVATVPASEALRPSTVPTSEALKPWTVPTSEALKPWTVPTSEALKPWTVPASEALKPSTVPASEALKPSTVPLAGTEPLKTTTKRQKRQERAQIRDIDAGWTLALEVLGLSSRLICGDFRAALERWIVYRCELGKPLTPSSLRAQVGELDKLADVRKAISRVDHAIERGWQGIYPTDEERGGSWPRAVAVDSPARLKTPEGKDYSGLVRRITTAG